MRSAVRDTFLPFSPPLIGDEEGRLDYNRPESKMKRLQTAKLGRCEA